MPLAVIARGPILIFPFEILNLYFSSVNSCSLATKFSTAFCTFLSAVALSDNA